MTAIMHDELSWSAEDDQNLGRLRTFTPLDTHALRHSHFPEWIWRHRYSCSREGSLLPKFLRVVQWNVPEEAAEAYGLMSIWRLAEPQSYLELLGGDFSNEVVRAYAVQRLAALVDVDLAEYLLQLVQCLASPDAPRWV